MLAAFTPAVKSPPSPTPEQAAVDQALNHFWTLVERVRAAADQQQPIHQVEETVFRQLLVIGRSLLQAFLASPGGRRRVRHSPSPANGPPTPLGSSPARSTEKRPYLSIFGEIPIERTCYGHDRVEAAPLDARLHLPRRQYSYLLQQWLGAFVVDDCPCRGDPEAGDDPGLGDHRQSVGGPQPRAGQRCRGVSEPPAAPDAAEEGPLLVVTADCKGVPLVRTALAPETRRRDQAAPLPAPANQRRGKGEKANKKKMAAVGAVYTIEPFVRTADDVIEEVMRKEAARRRPRPQNKRVRAELLVGKVALFLWLADEVIRRNPRGSKPVIFLSDGERALHDRQGEYLARGHGLYLGFVPCHGTVVEGGLVFLRGGDPEAGGPPVGGRASRGCAGREGAT